MKKPIIAAQLYTVRELLNGKNEAEIKSVLSKIKDMGYDAIQISDIGDVTLEVAELYKTIAAELNLDICATHFSLDFMEANTELIIEIHKKWECIYAGVGSMPLEVRTTDQLDGFISRMNRLGEKLKAAGIWLVYHNHKFEFEKMEGQPWLQYLLDHFDPSCVQLEIDTYWVQAGGASPVTWINKVAGNMGIMHLKDMRIVNDEQQFAEIGQGNLEWINILEAANAAKVAYAAVEQDSFTEDPLESLRISYEYLKAL
jgi:sugar phosphate isomerase/epimerase